MTHARSPGKYSSIQLVFDLLEGADPSQAVQSIGEIYSVLKELDTATEIPDFMYEAWSKKDPNQLIDPWWFM